jgi:alpha-galactosidase
VLVSLIFVSVEKIWADPLVVARNGNASISSDVDASTWTLTANGTSLTLNLGPDVDFSVAQFTNASKTPWILGNAPDTTIVVNGKPRTLGSRESGFAYQSVTTTAAGKILRLDAAFDLNDAGLRVTRHYAIVSGSPTIEAWTTYAALAPAVGLSNLNAIQVVIPQGTVHWVTGLQGDNATVEQDGAFTRRSKQLADGEHLALGAAGRSSEENIPWTAVVGAKETFYTALMWSGAWALDAARASDTLSLSFGLAPMTTTVVRGSTIDGPHVVFGLVSGGMAQASAALRSYVIDGIRQGRAVAPLVTYNTWFAYGTDLTESEMRDEIKAAAALGAELFVLDAGWYDGAGAAGSFDFDSGLGTWHVDETRFPNGLRPLTDYAHSLGVKFGVWVEPERVNLSVVGAPGPDESWLATLDGRYGSDHAAQICLASAQARQWVMDRLTALLDEVQPDYLKWDNNFWINCNRDGHDHAANDGNFAHVNALYAMLGELRARYPSMSIENVSGGGNRLDLGMLRYTDAAWMDDRTAPSAHVRHNAEGLSAVFPPSYLLSFVIDSESEPLNNPSDLSLYVRSRMEGALGLCFKSDEISPSDLATLTKEIGIYKSFRDALGSAAGALLTAQASASNPPAWDVLQASAMGGKQVIISAFQSPANHQPITVKPAGLASATTYEIRSVDGGVLGTATGADLAAHGIEITCSPQTASHVLILTAK